MPGLLSTLGSFGKRILETVRETGLSIRQAIGLAPKQARDITPSAVLDDLIQVARLPEKAEVIRTLPRADPIPNYLHDATNIPFNRPYAYEITASGRSVAGRVGAGGEKVGGRFTRDSFNITANRELSQEEIEEIALRRFGAGGKYPLLVIERMSVTGAMIRE